MNKFVLHVVKAGEFEQVAPVLLVATMLMVLGVGFVLYQDYLRCHKKKMAHDAYLLAKRGGAKPCA